MVEKIDLIECEFREEQALYQAYMPYVKGGGIFIRTTKAYELGHSITLSVQLPNSTESHLVEGKIVWITPKGAVGNKPAGIGVQLMGSNGQALSSKIEKMLTGKLNSRQDTDTI